MLALCKSLSESENQYSSCYISLAISLLNRYVDSEPSFQNLEEVCLPLISFVLEQLKLAFVSKNGRRYSSRTITTAFLWQLTSSSLYKKLRHLLILPSIGLLRKLSADLDLQCERFDLMYLEQRSASLNQQERLVVLMLVEVYTAQLVEYTNDAFIGLTEAGTPAKTVLTFTVQLICGKYKMLFILLQ